MRISEFIPEGYENRITRAELVKRTGLPDREIRDMIKRENRTLVQDGRAILSSSGASGYWISDSVEEISRYWMESENRRRQQYVNDAPIFELLCRLNGSRVVTVRQHQRRLRGDDRLEIDGQTSLKEA